MVTTHDLIPSLRHARRLLRLGLRRMRSAPAPSRRWVRPTVESACLERREAPSQLTIVGPAYAVAQVSYGSQAPKTAWVRFGGMGVATLGPPAALQHANDGTNGLAQANFGYVQKPPQVVLGFSLNMGCMLSVARQGASGRAA